MFRGASNPELATRFIEFILSPEGQKLWGLKAGAPGGPEKMALRNMPLRRDYYVEANLAHAADPELRPLEPGEAFVHAAAQGPVAVEVDGERQAGGRIVLDEPLEGGSEVVTIGAEPL